MKVVPGVDDSFDEEVLPEIGSHMSTTSEWTERPIIKMG